LRRHAVQPRGQPQELRWPCPPDRHLRPEAELMRAPVLLFVLLAGAAFAEPPKPPTIIKSYEPALMAPIAKAAGLAVAPGKDGASSIADPKGPILVEPNCHVPRVPGCPGVEFSVALGKPGSGKLVDSLLSSWNAGGHLAQLSADKSGNLFLRHYLVL